MLFRRLPMVGVSGLARLRSLRYAFQMVARSMLFRRLPRAHHLCGFRYVAHALHNGVFAGDGYDGTTSMLLKLVDRPQNLKPAWALRGAIFGAEQ